MKTLDAIKQEYARENNFCEWSEILYSIDDPAEIDEHFDKVAKLYAIEVSKEALKKAVNHVDVDDFEYLHRYGKCFKNVLSSDNIPTELL